MAKPRTPSRLGTRAAKFWRDVVGKYELRFDELLILEEVCREVDLIDSLQTELETLDSLRTRGSMGQDVADPVVSELRQHRNTLKALLASLKLPDEPAGEGTVATSATAAAVAMNAQRWGTNKTARGA